MCIKHCWAHGRVVAGSERLDYNEKGVSASLLLSSAIPKERSP
jgi:hypothetical protein